MKLSKSDCRRAIRDLRNDLTVLRDPTDRKNTLQLLEYYTQRLGESMRVKPTISLKYLLTVSISTKLMIDDTRFFHDAPDAEKQVVYDKVIKCVFDRYPMISSIETHYGKGDDELLHIHSILLTSELLPIADIQAFVHNMVGIPHIKHCRVCNIKRIDSEAGAYAYVNKPDNNVLKFRTIERDMAPEEGACAALEGQHAPRSGACGV